MMRHTYNGGSEFYSELWIDTLICFVCRIVFKMAWTQYIGQVVNRKK